MLEYFLRVHEIFLNRQDTILTGLVCACRVIKNYAQPKDSSINVSNHLNGTL